MVAQALKQIFTNSKYVLLAVVTGLIAFILATWLTNLGLVWQIATSESVAFADKVRVLVSLIGSIGTNFTIYSASAAVAISALFGINVATILYYVRLRRQPFTQAGPGVAAASLGGLASGLFGIGCAACGTLVLSPALTFLGASTLVTLLPLGGEEFGMLGAAMLVLSIFLSANKIGQLISCPIPAKQAD